MGNLLLTPQEESLVLVPPRFSVRGLTRAFLAENPMDVYFGNLFRREVIKDLHSFGGLATLDILICPEVPPSAAAHVSLSGLVPNKSVSGGSFNLHLNSYVSRSWHALGKLALGTNSGITGFAKISRELGLGTLSFSGSIQESELRAVGLRHECPHYLLGTDVPVSDPKLFWAWGLGRITDDFWVGVHGQPLGGLSGLTLSGSLEKRIPGTDSSYCVSSSYKMASKELTMGFSQHLVTHRKVYNIFEDKRVKFIANYVDIALEATSKHFAETDVAAGVTWQPNKNMLFKLHASTEQGIVGTTAVRNYWLPSVLVAVSAGVDTKGTPFIGGRFQVSNWLSTAEYQRGQPISTLPVTKWLSASDIDRFSGRNHF
jgi:hypothetical protein